MKLLVKEVKKDFQHMFTKGEFYEVEEISPNGKMVLITLDDGLSCQVVYKSSVYGDFQLVE